MITSSLNVLSLLYLSSIPQLNVGCFMAGPPILCHAALCGLFVAVAVMAWIATLIGSATALAMVSFIVPCLLAILFFICVCLSDTFYF